MKALAFAEFFLKTQENQIWNSAMFALLVFLCSFSLCSTTVREFKKKVCGDKTENKGGEGAGGVQG